VRQAKESLVTRLAGVREFCLSPEKKEREYKRAYKTRARSLKRGRKKKRDVFHGSQPSLFIDAAKQTESLGDGVGARREKDERIRRFDEEDDDDDDDERGEKQQK